MIKQKKKLKTKEWYLIIKQGFTLVEVLIVIAIIGILSGVVMVSTRGAAEKSRKAAAISTASSVLPELVTCYDDGGNINVPTNTTSGDGQICSAAGHNTIWPTLGETGWVYVVTSKANTEIPTMIFNLTKRIDGVVNTITCRYSTSVCE